MSKERGTVKYLSASEDCGLIHSQNGGDIYFRPSEFMVDAKPLEIGQMLEFEVTQGPRDYKDWKEGHWDDEHCYTLENGHIAHNALKTF